MLFRSPYQVYQYNGSNWNQLAQTTPTYKSYVAVISQAGTSAPTEDYVLENTLPFTPTYSYSAAGQYVINSATNGWTSQKTIVFINPGYMPSGFVNTGVALGWERNSNSAITIKSKDTSTGTDTDGLVFLATIEIRVYN